MVGEQQAPLRGFAVLERMARSSRIMICTMRWDVWTCSMFAAQTSPGCLLSYPSITSFVGGINLRPRHRFKKTYHGRGRHRRRGVLGPDAADHSQLRMEGRDRPATDVRVRIQRSLAMDKPRHIILMPDFTAI